MEEESEGEDEVIGEASVKEEVAGSMSERDDDGVDDEAGEGKEDADDVSQHRIADSHSDDSEEFRPRVLPPPTVAPGQQTQGAYCGGKVNRWPQQERQRILRYCLLACSCLYTFLFVGSFFGWGPMQLLVRASCCPA